MSDTNKEDIYSRIASKAWEMLSSLSKQGKKGVFCTVSEVEALTAAGIAKEDVSVFEMRASLEKDGLVVSTGRIWLPRTHR